MNFLFGRNIMSRPTNSRKHHRNLHFTRVGFNLLVIFSLSLSIAGNPSTRALAASLEKPFEMNIDRQKGNSYSPSHFTHPVPRMGNRPPSSPESDAPQAQPAGLLFVENAGQFDDQVRFQSLGIQGTSYLTDSAVWLTLRDQSDAGSNTPESGSASPN